MFKCISYLPFTNFPFTELFFISKLPDIGYRTSKLKLFFGVLSLILGLVACLGKWSLVNNCELINVKWQIKQLFIEH